MKVTNKYQTYPYSSVHRNALSQQYGVVTSWDLYNIAYSSKNFIQRLKKWTTLEGHTGCVNTIAWNSTGTLLLSGSDDYMLNIYDVYSQKMIHSVQSGHHANIFSAKFLPCTSDMKIVSCSGDGMLQYNELGTSYGGNFFNCHSGTTYEVVVTPGDPNTFLSCGEDGTVRLFDLRTKTKCHCTECHENVLIDTKHGVTSIGINPVTPYQLAVGCKDSYLYLFDCRTLGTSINTRSINHNKAFMPGLFCKFKPDKLRRDASCRITSVQYSNDGRSVLVSYCADYVYTFSVNEGEGKYMDTVGTTNNDNDEDLADRAENSSNMESDELPPVKRLRLRGDWSDTGPQACPETAGESVSARNLMQRMSVLFSAWLEDVITSPSLERRGSTESQHSAENDEHENENEENQNDENQNDVNQNDENQNDENQIDENRIEENENNEGNNCEACNEGNETDAERNNFSSETCVGALDKTFNEDQSENNDIKNDKSHTNHDRNFTTTDGIEVNSSLKRSFLGTQEVEEQGDGEEEGKKGESREEGEEEKEQVVVGEGEEEEEEEEEEETGKVERKMELELELEQVEAQLEGGGREEVVEKGGEGEEMNINKQDNTLPFSEPANNSEDFTEQYITDLQNEPRSNDEDMQEVAGSSHTTDTVDNDTQTEREKAALRIQKFLRQNKNKFNSAEPDYDDNMKSVFMPTTYSVFKGHRNARTMIKEANFWGEDYILSGSDCGRIFIWDRHTGQLIMLLQGDSRVVNCVQPHPFDPMLASSGIDHNVKIWAPLACELPDLSDMDEIIERNEQMLEKSCDTITVPASFVFRMLATFRSRRRQSSQVSDDDIDDDDDDDQDQNPDAMEN